MTEMRLNECCSIFLISDYQVTLYYDSQDEIEILIRLLSFGPIIKVTEPERMVQLIRGRVERQNKLACAFMEDEESG